MPRRSKPPTTPYPTGTPTPSAVQAPAAPTGMPYGAHAASLGAQQAVPLAGGAAPPTAPGPAGDGEAPPLPADSILQAAAAHQFEPVDLTGVPTQMEPITSGLPMGAGPGPGAVGRSAPSTADTLDLIAQTTGDALFAALAQNARMRATTPPPSPQAPPPPPMSPPSTMPPTAPDLSQAMPDPGLMAQLQAGENQGMPMPADGPPSEGVEQPPPMPEMPA